MVFLGIVVAFVIFSIVILVHEYGHFKAARIFWVKVDEFGLWIPPRAKKLWKDTHGTLFSLNWLPLGWFVKIAWETPNMFLLYDKNKQKLSQEQIITHIEKKRKIYDKLGNQVPQKDIKIILEKIEENTAEYNLSVKPAWQQIIIILAGVFMNFVLATVVFTWLFLFGVKPIGINDTIPIETQLRLLPTFEQAQKLGIIEKSPWVFLSPLEDSLALQSGIQTNDILLRINDIDVSNISSVQETIKEHAGKSLVFYIQRDTKNLELTVNVGDDGTIGSYLWENVSVNEDFAYKYGFLDAIKYGLLETYAHIKLTCKALGMLGEKILFPKTDTERGEAVNQLSGPIWIVDFISNSLGGGIVFLIIIWAIISINLGVFNLLPIPALDGGRFIFIVMTSSIQKFTGKRGISHRIEASIHVIFFCILIALSILIAYNDIVKIFSN